MKNVKIALFIAITGLTGLSSAAFAEDCGAKDYLGTVYSHTEYTYMCNDIRDDLMGSWCYPEDGFNYPAQITNQRAVYIDDYDTAPVPNWHEEVTDSANGYAYVTLYSTSQDDKNIESRQWYVDGVATSNNSSLRLVQSKQRQTRNQSTRYSIKLAVTDSYGHVCSKTKSVTVSGPTCGTRGSNVGCN